MPYSPPTPPLTPDGSPPPTVRDGFYPTLPPPAIPPPHPPAAWSRRPRLNPTWVMAGVLILLTVGLWSGQRWAFWGTLVLYSGILGFLVVAWGVQLTQPALRLTLTLLFPLGISLAIPLAVLGYLVMTWPTKYAP